MATIVVPTKLCGVAHDSGVTCGRPDGHPGRHGTFDHSLYWGDAGHGVPGAPAVDAAPCGLRHPMGKTCALPRGHQGWHRTEDYTLSWNTNPMGGGPL